MRIDAIDIIKGISIIMIVNVHLLSGQFFLIGDTYHVIAFFFTAGLVHGCTEKWKRKSLLSFVRGRLKQLGHPYLMLSLCYIIMHLVINVVRGDTLINIVIKDSFLKTVSLRGIGTLWFLPVLFFGEIVFFAAKRRNIHSGIIALFGGMLVFFTSLLNYLGLFERLNSIRLSTLSLSIPIIIVLSSLIASGFIALGHFSLKYLINLFQDQYFSSRKRITWLFAVCLISFIIDYSLIKHYSGDLHKLDIINPIVYIICSIAGLAFVTSLALIIKRTSKLLGNMFIYLGKNSLIIMTTHTEYYINTIANVIILSMVSMMGFTIPSRILSGTALLLIMLFEVGIVYIVNHTRLKRVFISK